MREIKFRAYVKFLREIHGVNELFRSGGVITDNYKYALAHDDVELMQFTGLTDKNGVGIYEGDIVKPDFSSACGSFDRGVIRFVGGAFVVNDGGVNWVFHGIDCERHEVIGNIYQNPELIEGLK